MIGLRLIVSEICGAHVFDHFESCFIWKTWKVEVINFLPIIFFHKFRIREALYINFSRDLC